MSQLKVDDLKHFAKDFLLKHQLDCFFHGNITLEMANRMTDLIIDARKEFLEHYAKDLVIEKTEDDHLVLQDWFKNDPVHCIIRLEDNINDKLNEPEIVQQSEPEVENNIEEENPASLSRNPDPESGNPEIIKPKEPELLITNHVSIFYSYVSTVRENTR